MGLPVAHPRKLLIVRDSSANKCGVIYSSFEIAASMLLSEEEFLMIKNDFVKEVIQKLQELAALEVKLFMVEKRHNFSPKYDDDGSKFCHKAAREDLRACIKLC